MHTPSTGRSICTIICGTIQYFIRLTKTITEHVTQVKKKPRGVFTSLCVKHDDIFRSFPKILD